MKFLSKSKDGGPESTVTAYWLIEWKWLFSIALLRFDNGSRDAYHSHAFNCISWLLKGRLEEHELHLEPGLVRVYEPSIEPIITKRTTFHKVVSVGRSWVLTFRGPWSKTWEERLPDRQVTLGSGRVVQ